MPPTSEYTRKCTRGASRSTDGDPLTCRPPKNVKPAHLRSHRVRHPQVGASEQRHQSDGRFRTREFGVTKVDRSAADEAEVDQVPRDLPAASSVQTAHERQRPAPVMRPSAQPGPGCRRGEVAGGLLDVCRCRGVQYGLDAFSNSVSVTCPSEHASMRRCVAARRSSSPGRLPCGLSPGASATPPNYQSRLVRATVGCTLSRPDVRRHPGG